MMTFQTSMLVLRLVHILAGIFWAGSVVVFAAFVYPAARAAGPAGGRLMNQLMERRRLALGFTLSAAFTILSGIAMYAMIGADSFGSWMRSPMGMTLGVRAIVAIIAAIIGGGVAAPASARLKILATTQPTPPSAAHVAEFARIQERLGRASATSAVLLVIAATSMAIARYV